MTPDNALFVRVIHLKNNNGSIYLNDLDGEVNKNPNYKIPVYIPVGATVDIPLNDAVLISYKRGSIFRQKERGLIQAFLFSVQTVVEVTTETYVMRPEDDIIFVDTSLSAVHITLPSKDHAPLGKTFQVKKVSNDLNALVVKTQAGDLLENASTQVVSVDPLAAFKFVASNTQWYITSRYPATGGGGGDGSFLSEEVFETGPVSEVTLAFSPIVGTENLYLNGVRLARGVDRDYTLSGSVVNFSFVTSPGDRITATYRYT
jgi:hypothetical protein